MVTGAYGKPKPDFREELERILHILDQPEHSDIMMRVIGALAFNLHCPRFNYIQGALGRKFTDIDFVAYSTYTKRIIELLSSLGYEEDVAVTRFFGEQRLVFHDRENDRHIDVFFNELKFCHRIPFRGRLEVDKPTIPLAELLLEKLQIVKINEKDIIDSIMLLREHPLGRTDEETINVNIIGALCSSDWGWWRTVTRNSAIIRENLESYSQLTDEDRVAVASQLDGLMKYLDEEPKSLRWRLRSLIGERVKWYEEVEELANR
ncbi:MAG: hypothetical protein HPY52_09495 [Firmicutes bacterium]|nr:hypothetical protein [Bacillota bacterium]